jgi:hypothetical protein
MAVTVHLIAPCHRAHSRDPVAIVELGRVLMNPERLDLAMSALPSEADIRAGVQHDWFAPIVLKNSPVETEGVR